MLRPLFLVLVSLSCALAADEATRRVLDAKTYHLGVAGMAEWHEFESSTPHGTQLDLTFSAEPNASESTLFLRQRNVKTTWNVSLNGKKIGVLEPLTQPLVLALAIPAGALLEGENRLSILRPPSRLLDDVVVGEITLDARPRAEAVGGGTFDVSVVDAETGAPLPGRLTLVDAAEALMPLRAVEGQQLAVRTGVIYSGDGKARFTTAPGTYMLYASRGFEYSVATQRITIAAGDDKKLVLKIRREVPTPGLIAADTHIHTLTFSKQPACC